MIRDYEIFKLNLHNLIQQSNLDVGAVYFILKDTFRDIESVYRERIQQEFAAETEETTEYIDLNNIKVEEQAE